jgi:hypothetical protein
MIAEPWMETLKAGVEAGFWKTEAAEDEQTRLAAIPGVAVAARWMFTTDACDGYLWGPDGGSRRLIKGLGYRLLDLAGWGLGLAWGVREGYEDKCAVVSYWQRHPTIYLNPCLWEEDDDKVRWVIGVMIGFCALGTKNEADASDWALDRYTGIYRARRERGVA